jgi:hypothetical protein
MGHPASGAVDKVPGRGRKVRAVVWVWRPSGFFDYVRRKGAPHFAQNDGRLGLVPLARLKSSSSLGDERLRWCDFGGGGDI